MSIIVNVEKQTLTLSGPGQDRHWPVSTALRGTGQRSGSFQTPLGVHEIADCIGEGLPSRAVFRGRRFTGEVWTPQLHHQHPDRDWILGRILWLSGCEPGWNLEGDVDSQRRYIYIHGTPDCEVMGQPASQGCIRMHCDAVLELFALVRTGMRVTILSGDPVATSGEEWIDHAG